MIASSGRGSSFGDTVGDRTQDPGRVGRVESDNMLTTSAAEMDTTVQAAQAIKQRNSSPPSKEAKQPVYHLKISWHPDDPKEDVIETARSAVRALGLQGHQVLYIQHTDRPHAHVHVVANLIHPDTGLVADIHRDHQKLDRWAHDYERTRVIRTFSRAAKYEVYAMRREDKIRGDFLRAVRNDPTPRNRFEKSRDKAELIKADFARDKAALRNKHQNQKVARDNERQALREDYRRDRQQLELRFSQRKDPSPAPVPPSVHRRPEWQNLALAIKPFGWVAPQHAAKRFIDAVLRREHATLSQTFDTRAQREKAILELRLTYQQKDRDLKLAHESQRKEQRQDWELFKARSDFAWREWRREFNVPDRGDVERRIRIEQLRGTMTKQFKETLDNDAQKIQIALRVRELAEQVKTGRIAPEPKHDPEHTKALIQGFKALAHKVISHQSQNQAIKVIAQGKSATEELEHLSAKPPTATELDKDLLRVRQNLEAWGCDKQEMAMFFRDCADALDPPPPNLFQHAIREALGNDPTPDQQKTSPWALDPSRTEAGILKHRDHAIEAMRRSQTPTQDERASREHAKTSQKPEHASDARADSGRREQEIEQVRQGCETKSLEERADEAAKQRMQSSTAQPTIEERADQAALGRLRQADPRWTPSRRWIEGLHMGRSTDS